MASECYRRGRVQQSAMWRVRRASPRPSPACGPASFVLSSLPWVPGFQQILAPVGTNDTSSITSAPRHSKPALNRREISRDDSMSACPLPTFTARRPRRAHPVVIRPRSSYLRLVPGDWHDCRAAYDNLPVETRESYEVEAQASRTLAAAGRAALRSQVRDVLNAHAGAPPICGRQVVLADGAVAAHVVAACEDGPPPGYIAIPPLVSGSRTLSSQAVKSIVGRAFLARLADTAGVTFTCDVCLAFRPPVVGCLAWGSLDRHRACRSPGDVGTRR
jgi:hypothetical protein